MQRVSSASVIVEDARRAEVARGLLVLVGFEVGDADAQPRWMGEKLPNLRIFEDDAGKMNLSLKDLASKPPAQGAPRPGLLLVPNFTLAGDCAKGRRPSFDRAMPPQSAEPAFTAFVDQVRAANPDLDVQCGVFRAAMHVHLVNDGPITLVIDAPC